MPARPDCLLFARDEAGNIIPGATVEVREPGTTTKIAETIYQDDDPDLDTYSNPFTAAADGRIEFYLPTAKRVDLFITKTGYTAQTVRADVAALAVTANTFQDEGTPLTQRSTINFTGDGVSAADNAGLTRTDVTVDRAVTVRKDGSDVGTRKRINFTEGSNVSVTTTDDPGNNEVDVQIGSKTTVRKAGSAVGSRNAINFIEGANITVTAADDVGNNEVDVTIAAAAYPAAGHIVKDEGIAQTQRAGLNFVGDSVAATDDVANNETDVTINHLATAVHTVSQPAKSLITGFIRDVPASVTNLQLERPKDVAVLPVVMSHAGSILAISVAAENARTGGTATFEIWKNGVATGLTCIINATNPQYVSTSQAAGLDTFVAGDRLDVRVTTTAAWAPDFNDCEAVVTVLLD